jgi:hypothetical protein
MEYFDPHRGRGVVYAFRGSTRSEAVHRFVLQGLEKDAKYRVHFHDHISRDRIFFGRELMSSGIRVPLAAPDSSELIFFNQVSRPSAKGNRERDFPGHTPREEGLPRPPGFPSETVSLARAPSPALVENVFATAVATFSENALDKFWMF